MPLFDFQCIDAKCDHRWEQIVKLNEIPDVCPKCGQKTVKKLIGPAGFRLKGTDWYKTTSTMD